MQKKPNDCFPETFEFFEQGLVQPSNKTLKELSYPNTIVVFRLLGEGICIVGFEADFYDSSMAIEMANILASKFASNLSQATGDLITISPPEVVQKTHRRFKNIIASIKEAKTYQFIESGKDRSLWVAYLRYTKGHA